MKTLVGKLVAINVGDEREDYSKDPQMFVNIKLDGFNGDRHRSFEREADVDDKESEGTIRRNDRQWSGISVDQLAMIEKNMDLTESLSSGDLGVNVCFEGIPDFSQLPKGTIFTFPSGAKLLVEEYNAPCMEMGEKLMEKFTTHSGKPLTRSSFPAAGIGLRGLVGVVEVPGKLKVGDAVTVGIYEPPTIKVRTVPS